MKIHRHENLDSIAFSILKALIPSLNLSDICRVRFVHPKLNSATGQNTTTSFPSFIITLKSNDLVQSVMRAKRSYNYFTTKDICLSSLNPEIALALPDTKIFINEVLSSSDHLQYISVKETAKSLGFRFVWHSNGSFLVRWRDKMKSYAVKSISDLNAIHRSLGIPQFNDLPHSSLDSRPCDPK